MFPEGALSWIQELRARHDPQHHRLVAPHVTVVYPTSASPEAAFVAHVASCARETKRAAVEFSSVREFRDEAAGLHLAYLVAGAGSDLFLRLRERLYSGPLVHAARRDIPFIPHVTLGRFASAADAASVAAGIRVGLRSIAGRVEAVDVVRIEEGHVDTIHREPLRAG